MLDHALAAWSSNRVPSRVSGEGSHRMDNEKNPSWLFLTNHGAVLLSLAGDPMIRISEIAQLVGVGERAVQQIIGDLVAEGYVVRRREGRRSRYEINRTAHLRHPSSRTWRSGRLSMCFKEPAGDAAAGAVLHGVRSGSDGTRTRDLRRDRPNGNHYSG